MTDLEEGVPDSGGFSELSSISTGRFPPEVRAVPLIKQAYKRFKSCDEGVVADYIPVLAAAPRHLFGISAVGVHGRIFEAGDIDWGFTIQSVSKPFVFALVCAAIGPDAAREKIGVNNTGLPFNSVMAIELNETRTMNPMVNAGAIATTSLVPGDTPAEKFEAIRDGLSRFAGRRLEVDEEAYRSESETNQRNRGIAKLLEGYGRMYCDAMDATDVYTRQCSLVVTTHDLAVMAATLADGGVNPVTGETVIEPEIVKPVLASLAAAGLYERSGDWLFDIGLPGKSGVSGGIFTVAPGKGGLATFSPPLDPAGNSVRGTLATRFLSERLGLNLFASRPAV